MKKARSPIGRARRMNAIRRRLRRPISNWKRNSRPWMRRSHPDYEAYQARMMELVRFHNHPELALQWWREYLSRQGRGNSPEPRTTFDTNLPLTFERVMQVVTSQKFFPD